MTKPKQTPTTTTLTALGAAPAGYTTRGLVRGSCGHRHRTIAAAAECLRRDRRGCEQQGGYSDRQVERFDGTELTATEHDLALFALDA